MTKIKDLLVHIQSIFPDNKIEDYYHQETAPEIWIEDSEEANKILHHIKLPANLPATKTFQIKNPKEKIIVILAVDGDGIVGDSQSSCDAAFFDDNCFCMAEFKYNAKSRKSKNKRLQKAIEQLEASIQTFDTPKIKALGYQLETYIGKPPIYPKTTPRIQTKAIEFSQKYAVILKEVNTKTFQ